MIKIIEFLVIVLSLAGYSLAFNITYNDNLAVYWGQNSYGMSHASDTDNWQKELSFYCADTTIDILLIAFLTTFFDKGGFPRIDLSNICSKGSAPVFNGTNLLNCQFLGEDIETCQSQGKIVTLSLGGASSDRANFTSASQATHFADLIWNLFLGGNSTTRPFGNAVLDGIDLDIENNATHHLDSFVKQIRSRAAKAKKKYYITAAPQCGFPDFNMETLLNTLAFDMVYVQFYNNICSLYNYNITQDWDFSLWDTWATNTSVNKDVKVFIGAPASQSAALPNNYVNASSLFTIIQQTRAVYSSFGGVMLWDASEAHMNGRLDAIVKTYLTNETCTLPPQVSGSVPIPIIVLVLIPVLIPIAFIRLPPCRSRGSKNCANVAT